MTSKLFALLAGSSMATIIIAAPALAQEQAQASPPETAAPAPAPAPAPADAEEDEEEIVVTGTQIRGATPAGAQIIGVTSEDVQEQGAATGNEVLAQIPQVANMFQNLPSIGGNSNTFSDRLPIARPALRNLPNVNTTGSLTLILVDGHRLVPVGTTLSGVDGDAVSSSLLERAEIMPDGGSAIYGSDAVSGVINFITKDRFDGLEVQGRYGFTRDNYWAYDTSVTGGTSWGSGSVFANVTYSKHDAVWGRDLDYIRSVDWNPASPLYLKPTSTNCYAPNIAFTQNGVANPNGPPATVSVTRLYPMTAPGGTIQPYTANGFNGFLGGGNRCDSSDNTSYYPATKRLSFSAGLTQEISDTLRLSVKGTWKRTENTTFSGPPTQNVTVLASNPNYRNVNTLGAGNFFAADAGATQQLRISYEPIFGTDSLLGWTDTEWWQITPQLTWDAPGDWQVRALASYGESESQGDRLIFNSGLAQTRVTSGLINPYNLPGSAPGAFDGLIGRSSRRGMFEFLDLRLVADGPLFPIWGGDVRAAVGVEYTKTDYTQRVTDAAFVLGAPISYRQTVKSAFGEVQIPLIGEDNDVPLVDTLLLSASARFDKYNDFGSTFNPMFGVTWKPVSWVKVRGNWNTSFTAPAPTDQLGVFGVSLQNPDQNTTTTMPYFGGTTASNAIFGVGTVPTKLGLVLNMGSVANLGPQETENWSLGIDIDPPFIPGLTLSAGYYNIAIDGLIASAAQPATQSIFDFHPELIYCANNLPGSSANCQLPFSLAELQSRGFVTPINPDGSGGIVTAASLIASGSATSWNTMAANYCGPDVYPACPAGTYSVFWVADNRATNLSRTFATGLDFSARYRQTTSWGSWDASFSGTHQLKMRQDSGPGTPVNDYLACQTQKWRWSANAGMNKGGWRGQITWQHSAGFNICPNAIGIQGNGTTNATGAAGQIRVLGYDTFDVFLRYEFPQEGGLLKDLSFTLNVNNIFNEDPPIQKGGGFFPGFPLAASSGGGGGAFTLGRFIQFGVVKKF